MAKEKSTSQKVWGFLIWLQIGGFICFLIFIAFVVIGILRG